MLVSSRLPPPPTPHSSMTIYDNNNQINSSTSLPKYFNVPFAIQHGYFRCVRYLLQLHYDPNERDGQLRTPLVLCSYVENDRWSLSLSQNLLEKGAKIALEDHARRNAMHHACALQRIHLVQLYLSCLDFNIEAKDCEGNTCLHYVAITGNCEIAELLIKSAEKLGIRLDQYVNREGCSAAVLALKYGHIECANQITHRDWDEFFVIPRPLSIYETSPTTDDNQTETTIVTTTATTPKKKSANKSYHSSTNKTETRPLTLSFGLLKIIFNDSDTGYSTRLAGLCKLDKQIRRRQHSKHKKQEAVETSTTTINKLDRTKPTTFNSPHYCSTEALVNETQLSNLTKEHQTHSNTNGNHNRTSPRLQLLMQQQQLSNKSNSKDNNSSSFIQKTTSKTHLSIDDIHKTKSNFLKSDTEDIKSKISIATMYRQTSNSTLNHSENNSSKKYQRPITAIVRDHTYMNPPPSRLSSAKAKPTQSASTSPKRKTLLIDRIDSASNMSKHQSTTNSPTVYSNRPISGVVHRSPPRSNGSACSIREAKGTNNRYNKPEELFGIRPEELFAPEEHQPKIFDLRPETKANDNTRLKRHQLQQNQHIWQQDVDKIIELYNIHHCSNYRKSAIPPPVTSTHGVSHTDTLTDLSQNSRPRRTSISKNSATNLKPSVNPKQSTLTTLNIPRRNSISRPSIKLTNT